MLALLIEGGLALLLVAGFLTQVVYPLVRGTPWFPIFESKEQRLRRELQEAEQARVEADLERRVKAARSGVREEARASSMVDAIRAYRFAADKEVRQQRAEGEKE